MFEKNMYLQSKDLQGQGLAILQPKRCHTWRSVKQPSQDRLIINENPLIHMVIRNTTI